jgi:hypothetical protein
MLRNEGTKSKETDYNNITNSSYADDSGYDGGPIDHQVIKEIRLWKNANVRGDGEL